MKTRREFVQGLIVSVGGATALAACDRLATIPSSGSFYTADERALVSRLSDLVIPRTETPGALDANVPGYLDGLMTEWASDDTRSAQREALQEIAAMLDAATGGFLQAGDAEAEAALTRLDAAAFDGNGDLSGYRAIKGYITQAYFATEEGAMQELKWVAVPGRWEPSVDITAGGLRRHAMEDFDAIVVGSGMSGGMSAKELTERGLTVLVLERGPEIIPDRDYTDQLTPWQSPNLDNVAQDEIAEHYPKQYGGVAYAIKESTKHFWVKDSEHPYEEAEGTSYDWLRGYHTAGRSIMWSRQTYRMGQQDFTANSEEGVAIDWPVRYEDLAPWYERVETFIGIAGSEEGLSQLPDSVFQPAFELTDAEKAFKQRVETTFNGRKVIPARIAHLTDATEEQRSLGRSNCQARNRCHHGCSFKAYFSSLNATLPAAQRTGNLTMVHNAIVQGLDYDPTSNRVTGVRVVDAETNEKRSYTARIVFLNASAIASAMILLQSKSETFPNGLANRSDQVGRNLMDHVSSAGVAGIMNGFEDKTTFGRRPSGGIYIPRYANVTENDKPYSRGFGFQGGARPIGNAGGQIPGIGREFKEAHRRPGPWRLSVLAFGEQLPDPNNTVTLHPSRRDRWGNPVAVFNVTYSDNERIMQQEAVKDAVAMFEAAGCINITTSNANLSRPGNRIHEMGTARMGRDPGTSVLNGWCQAHDVPNLFVTDGAFMTSSACQNPSLTYMAFSARAADHAAGLLAAGQL